MQRKFGIKRSFHCEDLPSISLVGLDQHGQAENDAVAKSSRKRLKRQRTNSELSSPCSAVCYCCEDGEASLSKPELSASITDLICPTTLSSFARFVSPATSHVEVTPELTPAPPSDGLPCFPSLHSRARGVSCDFPATAALERFMLRQRSSSDSEQSFDDDERAFSHSFEDRCDNESNHYLWPKFDDHHEDLTSPREVSILSIKSRSPSSQESFIHGRLSPSQSSIQAQQVLSHSESEIASFNPSPCLYPPNPSCKLLPTKTIAEQTVPTVNQITDALSRM